MLTAQVLEQGNPGNPSKVEFRTARGSGSPSIPFWFFEPSTLRESMFLKCHYSQESMHSAAFPV